MRDSEKTFATQVFYETILEIAEKTQAEPDIVFGACLKFIGSFHTLTSDGAAVNIRECIRKLLYTLEQQKPAHIKTLAELGVKG